MHLSDWVFGIPVPAAAMAQPEPEVFEGFGEEEFVGEKFEDDAEGPYAQPDPDLAGEVGRLDYETEDDAP